MKTAGEENPNSQVRLYNEPSPWDGKSEPSLLIHRGWKARKISGRRRGVFLDFSFYRTSRDLATIIEWDSMGRKKHQHIR
jgi:hypothetical protein